MRSLALNPASAWLYAIATSGLRRRTRRTAEGAQFFSGSRSPVFVGDLVNRGPECLRALRRIHAPATPYGDLGNPRSALLASPLVTRACASDDTLMTFSPHPTATPARVLIAQPCCTRTGANLCLLHAGLAPQWTCDGPLLCARIQAALRKNPQLYSADYARAGSMGCRTPARALRSSPTASPASLRRPRRPLALRAKGSPRKAQGKPLIPCSKRKNAPAWLAWFGHCHLDTSTPRSGLIPVRLAGSLTRSARTPDPPVQIGFPLDSRKAPRRRSFTHWYNAMQPCCPSICGRGSEQNRACKAPGQQAAVEDSEFIIMARTRFAQYFHMIRRRIFLPGRGRHGAAHGPK